MLHVLQFITATVQAGGGVKTVVKGPRRALWLGSVVVADMVEGKVASNTGGEV
jgi:hypothetical protein